MPILLLALTALAVFGLIGLLLATAAIKESKARHPEGWEHKHPV